jgi:Cu(I)/Ag(I) efflux system membrane fusion protein
MSALIRWARRAGILLLVILLGLAAGGALWYAHTRGWLEPVYARLHLGAGADQGGMGMNMPGMDMGGTPTGPPAALSGVPGHAEVTIPYEIQQRIGVTVGMAEQGRLEMTVRTVGIVQPNEKKIARIHLKTEGWVEKVFVDYTGQSVHKDDPLLSIYSQEFLTTQQDYMTARRTAAGEESGNRPSLAEASLRRLELLDVPPDEIRELEKTGKPQKYLSLRSPISGTVLAKNVFAGQYVMPQTELYEVADLRAVWVQAKVYEYELPHVALGQPAAVTLPAFPGREFTGKVVFIQPTVEPTTRTAQVRVELANPNGLFKPNMFANVVIRHDMGTGLLVPAAAVIRTGERDLAFRVESPGRFLPVEIQVSPLQFGNRFQVLDGLKAGDRVVTSADFLIDSESRLRAGGGGGMAGMQDMDMGSMPGMKH